MVEQVGALRQERSPRPGYRGIGSVIVSARDLADYREMFGLGTADLLVGPVLDVAGGAASFMAELHELGGAGVAVDPCYDRPAAEIVAAAGAGAAAGAAFVTEHPDLFPEHITADPAAHLAPWAGNARRFAAHYRPDSPTYRPARLPELPFADGAFALALCSHFLFSYPDHVDHDRLLVCLRELCRVAAEVRVYPLVDTVGETHPGMDRLRAELAGEGVGTELVPVGFRLYRTGTHALVARRR